LFNGSIFWGMFDLSSGSLFYHRPPLYPPAYGPRDVRRQLRRKALPTVTWTVRLVSLFTTTADVARPAANITWVAPLGEMRAAPLIVAKSPPPEVPDVRQYRQRENPDHLADSDE
jgi:hypothetical protein